MKIIFAADMSFNYFESYAGKEKASETMAEAACIFKHADYGVVNLENVLGNKESGNPIIKSGPNLISEDNFIEYIHALKPSIVGLANNHSMDYGENILFHTMELLKEGGYTCIGAGKNITDAYRPAKISKDGTNVSIIAICENEFGIATEDSPGTAGYSLGRVTNAIKHSLKEGCKPIIYFHGGNETNPFPSPGKVELYHHFIDLGAESVIAMHTHCPQGYEIYQGKPIVYSMGNFFFPTTKNQLKSWFYGYMCELDISGNDLKLNIHPYKFDFDKITLLKGEEKSYFLEYMKCLCNPITSPARIQELFNSWCLTEDYIDRLCQYKTEYFADGYTKSVTALKNIFGCEAHNELVRNTFKMIYESRIACSRPGIELIQKLQNMEYI